MSTINTCARCGAAETLYELDGEFLCPECLHAAGYGVCADCNEVVRLDDLTTVSCGDEVCESCLEDWYTYCDECEEWHYNDTTCFIWVDAGTRWERLVCEDCLGNGRFFQCADCGDWRSYAHSSAYDVDGVGEICWSCYMGGDYHDCDDCGCIYRYDDLVYDDEDDAYYCSICAGNHNHEVNTHVMHDHDFKPVPKPRTRHRNCTCDKCTDVRELLFGVELEVDKGCDISETISEIADACPDVYMKHDGSLSHGFEIVTHPCTLDYHMYEFKWRHITAIAKRHDFKSHDARTCGLHVHVGRYQLGDNAAEQRNTVGKAVLLVDRHWDTLVKFSRRIPDQLHWARRPQIDTPMPGDSEERLIEKAFAADNNFRYQAVNLCNTGTIEFRLFNGTLKRDTIMATLQLVSNLCLYAKSHTVTECLASSWADLVGYKAYDELTNYCEERHITDVIAPDPIVTSPSEPTDTDPHRPLRVGDRVVSTGEGIGHPGYLGVTGTVVYTRQDEGPFGLPYAVVFDNWLGGHTFEGYHFEIHTPSGWWCNDTNVALIA